MKSLRLPLLFLGLSLMPQALWAACSSPTGQAGQIIWASNLSVPVYCDGTTWQSMAGTMATPATDARIGTITANKWCVANGAGTGFDCTSNSPTVAASGSTGDVQYNSGGAFASDTGIFTYSGGVLSAPNLSLSSAITGATATFSGLGTFGSGLINGGLTVTGVASLTAVSASTISGTLIQAGATATSCVAGLNGAMRYNSTSNTLQVCLGTAWTSLSSSTTSAALG